MSEETCFLGERQFLFCCQKLKDRISVASRETVCLEVPVPRVGVRVPQAGSLQLRAIGAGLPLAACHLLGITMPFVLILVDISFHTLLNEPLQKGWEKSLL